MGEDAEFFRVVDSILYPGIVLFFGLMLGSFSTALIYRVPRGISWVYDRRAASARSSCPVCHTLLGAPDLVPLFSWIFLRGRCRHCSAPIGVIYPLSELACLAGCLGVFLACGLNPVSFFIILAVPFLVALFVIDLRFMILPNHLVFILGVLGIFHAGWIGISMETWAIPVSHFLSAGLYGLLSWSLRLLVSFFLRRESMGWGDVKFFAAAGAWIGMEALPLFLILSGGVGIFLGLLWRYVKKERIFPFGPALILALYAVLIINA